MDSTYTISGSTTDTAASGAAVVGVIFIVLLIELIVIVAAYIFFAICLSKIFKKAGVESWKAWVPFLNTWKTLELGGQQGFWAVLAIIPVVNIASAIFMYVAMYHIGKKLGKGDAFVLLAIFLSIVWLPWLAFDHSAWDDSKGAPRTDTPTMPVAPPIVTPVATTPVPPQPATTPTNDQNQA